MVKWLCGAFCAASVGFGCQAAPSSSPPVQVAASAPVTTASSSAVESPVAAPGVSSQKGLSMIPGKPLFSLRLDIEGCVHDVYVNGGLVTRNLEGGPEHTEYPVNHWLRSGANELQVKLLKPEGQADECNVKAVLRYKDEAAAADAPGITLATLAHDARQAPANAPTEGSSPSGVFDSRTGQPATSGGDVRVSPAVINPLPGKMSNVHLLTRTVEMTVPFPEWAFFRGEVQRPDWDYESKEARQPVYGPLLAAYQALHDLLAKGNVDAFVDACEERSREMDQAYYLAPGSSRETLRKQVAAAISNPKFELESLEKEPGKYWGYLVGSTGRLVALTQGRRASALLSFQKKTGEELALVFPAFFRIERGKHIVSR
jgi:hypothetical protein